MNGSFWKVTESNMIHGVLNVYKEAGFTSHDVVAKLRGILKQKKTRSHRDSGSG